MGIPENRVLGFGLWVRYFGDGSRKWKTVGVDIEPAG